ncbi:uncharacterized protein PRCAT00001102001 [Priceomyces carsonii]|uniref:uncharacterized protein n=1 Tax=Priceomyces carsonii TaxID=28549 RepID=UPI002ED89B8A|nr:unnamed protein product [Priceomyces carsonii]
MSNSTNLRPYYDHDTFNAGYSVIFKPGIGLIDTATDKPITSTLAMPVIEQVKNKGLSPGKGLGITGAEYSYSKGSEKNYVYDLEFQEYFDFNNLVELLKNLMWNFCKNYLKTLISQPLEIVRLVLQVGKLDIEKPTEKKSSSHSRLLQSSMTDSYASDYTDSDSEPDYFQSTGDSASSQLSNKISIRRSLKLKELNKIRPTSKHTMDIISAIVTEDGPFALFRGINASFIYHTLSHTIEAWITGFLSPFLGIPDPFFLDLTHSTDPLRSLWLSVCACVLTGLILIPLDLIKVRLMITQFNRPALEEEPSSKEGSQDLRSTIVNNRSIRESIRHYPISALFHPPKTVAILTALHQFSTSIFRKMAPYILFIKFNIDANSSPSLYTVVNLALLIMEFFIKLPVENLLRKEEVRFLLSPKSILEDEQRVITIDNPDTNMIVEFNDAFYKSSNEQKLTLKERIQSLELFNGWRVGVLNVIGFWGYNILKRNDSELNQERL